MHTETSLMDIEVAPYRPEQFESLVRLLDGAFRIRNADKAGLIRWKFFDPIHRGGTVMAVAIADGQVVSQYANTPVALSCDGLAVPAMICADMATAPEYRGRGLISRLARMVYAGVAQSGAALSIGYSNDAGVQVDRNAKGYGYRVVGRFARYLRPVVAPLPTPYRLEPAAAFDEPLPQMPGLCLHKSAEYLTWRYLRKPNQDYRVYRALCGADHVGYVVMRDARMRAHILDIIGEPTPGLLRAVQNAALRRGKPAVMAYVLDNGYWRAALRGFVRLPPHPRFENYYLTVKPHCEPMPPGWDTPQRWRLMGGDVI